MLVDSKRNYSDINNNKHSLLWSYETLIFVTEKSPLFLRTTINLDLDWANLLTTSVCSLFQLRILTQQWRVLCQLSCNISTNWNRAGTVSLSRACLLCMEYGLCTKRRREEACSQGQWTLKPMLRLFFLKKFVTSLFLFFSFFGSVRVFCEIGEKTTYDLRKA